MEAGAANVRGTEAREVAWVFRSSANTRCPNLEASFLHLRWGKVAAPKALTDRGHPIADCHGMYDDQRWYR